MKTRKTNKPNENISDIDKLKSYLNGSSNHQNKSIITGFENFGKVYRWTNENFNEYPTENLEGKKILTVTSSGDHALEAILFGATNIDSIDINVFCKYYSALKIAMIKKYDYKGFFNSMNQIIDYNNTLSIRSVLDEVSLYLTEEEQLFWNEYNKCPNNNIFCGFNYPEDNRYYSKDIYGILKENIDGATINYYDGDIININEILSDKIYDCVYLSNILERIQSAPITTSKKLLKKISNHLNDDGVILSYFFNMNLDQNEGPIEQHMKKEKGKYVLEYFINNHDIASYQKGVVKIMKNTKKGRFKHGTK